MDVVIYGAGSGGRKALKVCNGYGMDVVAFIDKDKNKKNMYIEDIPVKVLDEEGNEFLKRYMIIIGTEYKDAEKYIRSVSEKYISYDVIKELFFEYTSVKLLNEGNICKCSSNKIREENKIKNALILGIETNEGFQLAKLLIRKGYNIYCIITDENEVHSNYVGKLKEHINIINIDVLDNESLKRSIEISNPHEIYSFYNQMFIDTNTQKYKLKNNTFDMLCMLETIRNCEKELKLCQGFTYEIFGHLHEMPQTEMTKFVHKDDKFLTDILNYWNIKNYRENFESFICSCILFKNESEYAEKNSFIHELLENIVKVKCGIREFVEVNDLDCRFDVGSTEDYVNAMWLMLQNRKPDDYVIATNESRTIKDVIELAFDYLNIEIEWNKNSIEEFGRDKASGKIIVRASNKYAAIKNDNNLRGNPKKAIKKLKWQRRISFEDLIEKIVEKKLKNYKKEIKISENIVNVKEYVTDSSQNVLKSCICTQEKLQSDNFKKICMELNRNISILHRKDWELAYITQALKERGMLKDGKLGLGFAVGEEPLPAYFASKGCDILATDLDINNEQAKGWMKTGQNAAGNINLLNKSGICDAALFEEKVKYRNVDMNDIPNDLKKFDFCWSACAIEHVGSLEKSKNFLKNMLKVIKPGGIAVHTTEYNLSSNEYTVTDGFDVVYRKKDIEEIANWLRENGHSIELDFRRGKMEGDLFVDQQPSGVINPNCHLHLDIEGFNCTSFGLIIQKGANKVLD